MQALELQKGMSRGKAMLSSEGIKCVALSVVVLCMITWRDQLQSIVDKTRNFKNLMAAYWIGL